MNKIDINEIKALLEQNGPDSKVYLGCDSYRKRINGVWHASYTTVVIVHKGGRHGCKVFGEISVERDYTGSTKKELSKPRMRLMNETYKVAEMYLRLGEALEDYEVEIHLDINPDERHGSSVVVSEAIGYIRGVCNIVPLVKPNSFAAAHCADHFRTYAGRKTA